LSRPRHARMSSGVGSCSNTSERRRLSQRLSTAERRQQGPSSSSAAATYPEKSAKAQSRKSGSRRACAFFSPRLAPVLERRKRHKDAVVAPEVPTRGPVGQAGFDHQPYRQSNHAVGVLSAGGRQIREGGATVLTTLRTGGLRIRDHEITRTPQVEMASVMQRPRRLLVPRGRVTTTRARLPDVVATVGDALGLGQVCGCGDPGAGVGSVLPWTVHRVALLAQRFGPALYDKPLRGATRCSRYSLEYHA
jgi:hypothetical protein